MRGVVVARGCSTSEHDEDEDGGSDSCCKARTLCCAGGPWFHVRSLELFLVVVVRAACSLSRDVLFDYNEYSYSSV